MRVYLRVHRRGEVDIELDDLPPDFDVYLLKRKISQLTAIAPEIQRLVQCGIVLAEDSAPLADVVCMDEPLYVIPWESGTPDSNAIDQWKMFRLMFTDSKRWKRRRQPCSTICLSLGVDLCGGRV